MPRRPRVCPAGMPVHVVQRGNNRQVCFAKEADMAAYANWLGEYAKKFDVEVHGWVFMTNHVHLLLTPKDEAGVSKLTDLGMSDIARQSHYRKWMSEAMATEVLGKIRACLEKGLVLGTDRFREQVSGLMR
jgi:REP element-mobilizing transposase RayT